MESTATIKKKSVELKKHIGAIHSLNRLSLVERKIANALLYNAYDHLITQERHHIHIATLSKLIGYDSKDDRKIKKALMSLISVVMEWNLVDKNSESTEWVASAMIADASIQGALCTYSYSQRMRELLHHPEIYGRLNMEVQARFQSGYGLALYENCIRYQNLSQTPWFELETFRKLMGVEGDKYPMFRDLKRRVIDPAVNEVNQYSPITIEPRINRVGHAVKAIQFIISNVKNSLLEIPIAKKMKEKLRENFGCSAQQADMMVTRYEEQYIMEKMTLIEASASFQSGKIKNLALYLDKALAEDYQLPKSSQEILHHHRKKKEEDVKLNKMKEEKASQYRIYQNKEILLQYEQMLELDKTALLKDFEQHISKLIYYKLFVMKGLSDPLVNDRFCDFIRANRKELLSAIIPFDEFLAEEGRAG